MLSPRILIVEDELIIALDIQNSLRKAGYVVVDIVTSASEAFEQATHYHPDLVLMDIRLDGNLDGVDIAKRIQAELHRPVVYLTAHADSITLTRAKKTEPFGYVIKPFDDHELVTAIEIALSRHRTEEAMRLALEKEREFNELKSRFIAVVSHEFRNPLNAILFSSELLEQYGDQFSQEKRQIYIQRIQNSVKYMNQLLSDVLTIGQTESGSLPFSPTSINLTALCQDLIEELVFNEGAEDRIVLQETIAPSSQSDAAGLVSTEASSTEKNRTQWLDEKLLRHILINLLSNALKYSADKEKVFLTLLYNPNDITIQVQDRGIGIPPEDHNRLFDSFYRASNVQSISGTGLGLSIVKQCVDLHGGTIAFSTKLGFGTLFTVTLPLSPQGEN